ncbi:hypothetical protein GCM10027046_09160 [Uliginosibacterium flavum]|uniref:PEP-CTERM sorting domain-containing protein n=1 Tax=Uliginosibacterium flavum TaxID=1396831 RepID=A0ABV2TJC9_9RHOO
MKFKALVIALAMIGAGAANANISLPSGSGAAASSSVLFTMMNTGAATSSMFDLGLDRGQFNAAAFGGVTSGATQLATLTWNFTSNSVTSSGNWGVDATSAIASLQSASNSWSSTWNAYSANAAGSVYDVFASDRDGTTGAAQHLLSTVVLGSTNKIETATNAKILLASSSSHNAYVAANTVFGTHGTADNGANIQGNGTSYQGSNGSFKTNWNGTMTMFSAAAGVDQSLGFYGLDGVAGSSGNALAITNFNGTWSMDAAAGTLTYSAQIAAVPEPSSIAMLLAGLGLMGFIARRRLS